MQHRRFISFTYWQSIRAASLTTAHHTAKTLHNLRLLINGWQDNCIQQCKVADWFHLRIHNLRPVNGRHVKLHNLRIVNGRHMKLHNLRIVNGRHMKLHNLRLLNNRWHIMLHNLRPVNGRHMKLHKLRLLNSRWHDNCTQQFKVADWFRLRIDNKSATLRWRQLTTQRKSCTIYVCELIVDGTIA